VNAVDTVQAVDDRDRDDGRPMRTFRRLLANALVSGVMSSFVWFALTFWVYLETRSVIATSVIAGAFAVLSALLGMFFGTFVDHHRKHTSMLVSSAAAVTLYGLALAQYAIVSTDRLLQVESVQFWLFVALILAGSVAGNLRSIALSTVVSLLVPADRRDRANGMVGTVMGISFTITSVLSGLVVGRLGMGWALVLAVSVSAASILHLVTIRVHEPAPARHAHDDGRVRTVDFRGTWLTIRGVPGLIGLIGFAAFNNLLGGVFMSLMDAYGLSLVSVETWGLLFGVISLGFIVGGMVVARRGLGPRPMRIILIGNLVNWITCSLFTTRSSVVMVSIGMAIWITLIPAIEAAEQTVLQRVVPFDHQGRVFGFAQTVENAASPVTAFLIGPLAQLVFIPTMTDGFGADLIGDWFGRGPERGLALIFTLAGIIGVAATLLSRSSGWYRSIDRTSAGGDGSGVAVPA
jgi:DHA3 family multidrug efflux protein-like MFS transporter